MLKTSQHKLTETVKDLVYRANIEIAVKSEPVYSLAETLSAKNVTMLRKLCKLHGVAGYSKMDKSSCIAALTDKITDKKALTGILLILSPKEWKLFKRTVKMEQTADDMLLATQYEFMLSLGIMNLYYYDGHFRYIVPAEIKEAYADIEKTGFPAEKEHGDLLNMYASAAVNLYGTISQEDFVKLFNSQNKRKTDTDEVFGTLIKFVAMDYIYCFWDEYIVSDSLQENDFQDVGRYAAASASKPRYLPPKDVFLRFSDLEYVEETPQFNALTAFINRNFSCDAAITNEIAEKIYFLCRREASTQTCARVFDENGLDLSAGQTNQLDGLLAGLRNNVRLWVNNGHTSNELAGIARQKPYGAYKTKKVGRNDPCPCGSGLKYKRCCGK